MPAAGLWARVWPSLVALLGTLAVVGVMLVLFGQEPTATTTTPTATPTPTVPATPASTGAGGTAPPAESPGGDSPAPAPTPAPAVAVTTDVLNSSGLAGLGTRVADKLRADGWPVGTVGDFPGIAPPASTVYYPAQLYASAQLLAQRYPQFDRLRPVTTGLPTDRLTLVVRKDAEAILS